MVGSRAEKHHSSKVGKNWVMMGFCSGAEVGGDVSGRGSLVSSACFAYRPPPAPSPGIHSSQGPISEVQGIWKARVEGGGPGT